MGAHAASPVRASRRESRRRPSSGVASHRQGSGGALDRPRSCRSARCRDACEALDDRAWRATRPDSDLREHDRRRARSARRPTDLPSVDLSFAASSEPLPTTSWSSRWRGWGPRRRTTSSSGRLQRPVIRSCFSCSLATGPSARTSRRSLGTGPRASSSRETGRGRRSSRRMRPRMCSRSCRSARRGPWSSTRLLPAVCRSSSPTGSGPRTTCSSTARTASSSPRAMSGPPPPLCDGWRRIRDERRRMGARSRERVQEWGYGPSVAGFLTAVRDAAGHPPR